MNRPEFAGGRVGGRDAGHIAWPWIEGDYGGGVESWRIIAAVLLGTGGLLLVLLTMAKVRDRTGSGGTVAISGAISVTVLALLTVLTLTVLAPGIAWGAVILVGVAASTMLLVG